MAVAGTAVHHRRLGPADRADAGHVGHPPVRRPGLAGRPGWPQLATALRGWLSRAEPGSDAQLTFARALADIATSPEDLDLLAGLLDGSVVIDGLAVDTELRWLLLHRLVAMGAADRGADRHRAGQRPDRRGRAARDRGPGRHPDPGGEGRGPGPRSSAATCRTRCSGPPSAASRTSTRPSCWRPSPSRSSRCSAACGRTGARTWRSTSPPAPTRSRRSARRRSTGPTPTSRRPARPRRCAGCSARTATTSPASSAAASGTPGELERDAGD